MSGVGIWGPHGGLVSPDSDMETHTDTPPTHTRTTPPDTRNHTTLRGLSPAPKIKARLLMTRVATGS